MATHRGIVSDQRPFNDQWFDVEVFSAHTHLFYVLRLESRLSLSIGEWVEWSQSLYNQSHDMYVVQENSPADAYRAGVSSDFDAEVMQQRLVLTVHAMYCSDPSKESSNRKVLYSLEVGRVAVPPDADVTTLMKPDQPAKVFVRKCTHKESYGTRFVVDRCQMKESSLDEQAVRRMQHDSPSWASIQSEEELSGAVSGVRVEEQPRFSPAHLPTYQHTQQHSTFRPGNGGFGQRSTGNSGFRASRSVSNEQQQQGSEGSGQQPSKRGVFSGRGVTQSQSANNLGQQSGGSERRGGAFSGSSGGTFSNRGGFGGGEQRQEEPWGGAQERLSKNQQNKALREMCRDTYFALMLGGEWYRKMNPTGLRKGENAPFTIWTKDWGYSHCSVNYVSAEGENRNRTIQKGEWCKAYFKILKNNEQRVERIIDYIEPPFRTKYYEQHSCTVDIPSLNMMECSDACVEEHRFVDHLTLGAIAVPINDYNTYLNQSVWCKVELDQHPLADTGVHNSPVAWWRAVEVRPEGAGEEEGGGAGEGGMGVHKEGYEEEVTTVPPDFDSDDDERVTVIRNPAASNPVMFNGSYGPVGSSGGAMGGGKGKAASVHNTSGGSGGVGGASRFGGLGPAAGATGTGAGFGQGRSAASSKSESAMPATKRGYSTAAALRSHAPTPASQMFGGVGTGEGGGGRAASGRSSASGVRMNILHSITRDQINQQIDYQSAPLNDVGCIVMEKTTENSIVFTSHNKFCLLPGSSHGVGAWLTLNEARRLLVPLAGCVLVSTLSFDPLPDPLPTKVSEQKVQLELQLGEFGSALEKTERGLMARTKDIGSDGPIVSVLIPWTVSNAHLLGGMDGSEWAGRFRGECNWRLWAHPRSEGRGGVDWEATEVIGMVNPPPALPARYSGMDDIDLQKASHFGSDTSAFNAMSAVNKQRVADLNSPRAMGGAGMGGAFGQVASSRVSTSSAATGRSAFAEDLYQHAEVDRSQMRGTSRRDQRLADYLTQLWRIPGVQTACKTEPNGGFELYEKICSEFK